MTTNVYGRGLVGLFKKTWNDYPEILGSTFMGMIGLSLAITGYVIYQKNDGDNRRYKMEYTVLRHDDPKVAFIRKD